MRPDDKPEKRGPARRRRKAAARRKRTDAREPTTDAPADPGDQSKIVDGVLQPLPHGDGD